MDDIIVLILTLLFIVAGIFGQMKKRQLPPEQGEEAKPLRENFWEELEDEEKQAMGITEHLQPAKEVAKEDRFHSAENMMRREFSRDKSLDIIKKRKTDAAKKKKFPLKKAVIYSEILNRKYF